MNQDRARADNHLQRLGWLWRRKPASAPGAPLRDDGAQGAAAEPRHARFAWFGRSAGRAGSGPSAQVPALRLARDWLLASGGKLREDGPDLVAGTLPDGMAIRYTSSVQRARHDASATLLAPGTVGLDALLDTVAAAGNGLTLRLDAGTTVAESLARTAFVPSTDQSEAQVAATGASPLDAAREAACLHPGRYLVLGVRKGVREAQVLRRWEGVGVEYTFQVSTTSPRGRREELMRVGVDRATGAYRAPVSDATLARARVATADSTIATDAVDTLPRAQALLEPAIQAAARLARVQVLPEYERRQTEITLRAEHLIGESLDAATEVLAMRERELQGLAESHAVEVDVRLVGVATLLSPWAEVRVRFAGGGEATVEVDLARGAVAAPRCEACGASWLLGARCGEGHVTCLACQARCVHCGARRCSRCSSPAITSCSTCSEPACATCLRAAARGRHRVAAPALRDNHPPDRGDVAGLSGGEHGGAGAPEDLRVADLDVMTPATWRACVQWLLEGYGYRVERDLSGDLAEPIVQCRRATADTSAVPWTDDAPAPVLVALGHRPADGETVEDAAIARATALGRDVPGARLLLITTGRLAREFDASRLRGVAVLDRDRLGSVLVDLATRYRRTQETAEDETEIRARAAGTVRTTLMHGLHEAAALAGSAPPASAAGAVDVSPGRGVATVREGAQVARQALAALETLVEEWEAAFATTVTRTGTQDITVSPADLENIDARARHLVEVLRQGCEQVGAIRPNLSRTYGEWHQATVEELQRQCAALSLRCESLQPAAWRVFEAVRDRETAARGIAELAASGRAAARARRLWEELEVRAGAATLPAHHPRG